MNIRKGSGMYSASREMLLERRQNELNKETLWDSLTPAQKFSANHFAQEGYELAFIRRSQLDDIAVFLQGEHAITVGAHGKITMNSTLNIR